MLFHFYFLLFPFEGMDLLNSRRAWALGIVGLAVCFEFCCWCEGCLDEEREALLQIKHDINYPNGSSLSDWKGDDCCQWPRVSCNNHTSRVNEIDLYEVREEDLGTWYPNATLFAQFKELFYLYLSGNQIDGWRMPEDICELRRLKALGLYRNNIKGRIHPCIGNMRSLEVLDLGYNRFEGSIPPLDNLTSLSWFYFDGNDLDGVLTFSTFANLSKLTLLNLSNNPQLQVETESPTWIPSFQLKYLYLSNCQLNQHSGGAIPSFLATQYKLETIDLSNSKLFGRIPSWLLYNMTSLRMLMLGGNSLGGSFPRLYQHNNSSIGHLDVSENHILNPFPSAISMFLPQLWYLNMSRNALQGSIPLDSSNARTLQILDLSDNELSGKIPDELLANSSSLEYLSLSNNKLHGDVLPRHCNMHSLKYLQLDGNGFTGRISRALSNSTGLLKLDFRRNSLFGSIPSWLPALSNLTSLLLGDNNFVDDIPAELCRMQNLHLLDFSKNRLSGNLPSCFNNISSWMNLLPVDTYIVSHSRDYNYTYQNMIRTKFMTKGNSLSYESIPLSLMTGIDFSLNQLTGNIPSQMGHLKVLHSMNLSHNLLTGPFPESFKYLEQIESLDLSYNKLTGVIPPQITQLTTLGTFSVAFNNLSGALPDLKNQFITFNESSYAGNPSLCGEPLKRRCSADIPFQPKGGRTEEEKEESRIIDNPVFFYSCVAMAHALGFWIFIGLLVFNKGWRFNFFRTVDRYIYIGMCDQNLSTTWMI
ncbi:receptor-like protein 1 isoform X1 [Magnolia sinica]|uniref:receptor-like protein 1 isoform X1 n=1 Tax=Magnolia sinica TaxID=86752 RepID=UPI0026594258|nr:receptor-like protein 1 isoform X1 [Magnolia sinica]